MSNYLLSKFPVKGFALTQILLAIALASCVSIGIVGYYRHVDNQRQTTIVADQIVNASENSSQLNRAGRTDNSQIHVNGISLATNNGNVVITEVSSSKCRQLASALVVKGTVDFSCGNSSASQNTVTFHSTSNLLASKVNTALLSGTPDAGATNQLDNLSLDGNVITTVSTLNLGALGSWNNIIDGSIDFSKGLANGKNGSVVSGGVTTSPSAGSPPVYTGSGSMSCRWRLTNAGIYGSVVLTPKATSCGVGNISTSNQTGLRTYSCPNPTAAINPVGTDTWSGGSCAPTCNSRLGTGSYVTTSLGQRATPCGAGQASTSNQTGTKTWSCANPSTASNPIFSDAWTGGSCAALCKPLAYDTRNLGCPSGQLGAQWQRRDSSCPAQTGSPVWGGWYGTSNTCKWDTSCVGKPAGYAWNSAINACAPKCVASASQGLGSLAPTCSAGTTPDKPRIGTRTWSCPTTFGAQKYTDSWTAGSCKANIPFKVNSSVLCVIGFCYNNYTHVLEMSSTGLTNACKYTVTMSQNGQTVTTTASTPAYGASGISNSSTVSVGGVMHTVKVVATVMAHSQSLPTGACDGTVN